MMQRPVFIFSLLGLALFSTLAQGVEDDRGGEPPAKVRKVLSDSAEEEVPTDAKYLDFSTGPALSPEQCLTICVDLHRFTQLQELIFSNCPVSSNHLGSALHHTLNLQALELQNINLGDQGLIHLLPALEKMEKLIFLDLDNNQMTDGCILPFVAFLRQSNLEVVGLSNNRFGDFAMQLLSYNLPNTILGLYVEGNAPMSETGKKALKIAATVINLSRDEEDRFDIIFEEDATDQKEKIGGH